MNSRRTFLLNLPLLTVATASAQTTNRAAFDSGDFATTSEELKKSVFATGWQEAEFARRKFLFALTDQGDWESYIDLHGWIYNRGHKGWLRILKVQTRRVGNAVIIIDTKKGFVSLRGKANNEFNGVEVFRFDLRATSDDAGYEK